MTYFANAIAKGRYYKMWLIALVTARNISSTLSISCVLNSHVCSVQNNVNMVRERLMRSEK